MANQVEIRMVLTQKTAVVFRALTDDEMVIEWFVGAADIDLSKKQYDFWGRFTPENPGRNEGRHPILSSTPNEHLRYQWQTEYGLSEVDIRLQAHEEGTLLALKHEIFPEDEVEENEGQESAVFPLEDFWFLSLENLRRYLDGRSVTRCDFSIHVRGDVVVSFDIDASPEEVFEGLIRPEQLNRWIARQAKVEPQVGGGFVTDLYQDGLYIGWHFFISWLRSLVEYDNDWQPPVKRLAPGMGNQYPASVAAGQSLFEW